jgi:hypothetical protein
MDQKKKRKRKKKEKKGKEKEKKPSISSVHRLLVIECALPPHFKPLYLSTTQLHVFCIFHLEYII